MSAPIRHEKLLGKIVFEAFKKEHTKSIDNHIDTNYFNFAVDILLPKCEELVPGLDEILTDHPAYLARQVPLATLVTEEFTGCFVHRGKMCALSYGTSIDCNDCLAILPTGKLILHLTKDTFQELGLEGKLSEFGKGTQKYVVEINMHRGDFNPGKKFYERVKWCLANRIHLKFDLLLTWVPVVDHICPTSIHNFFKEKNIVCNRIKIAKKTNHFKSPLPSVNYSDPENKSGENCGYLDMFEWLGACAIGADLVHGADDFVSSYTCPTSSEKLRSCVGVQYQGMFTPETIKRAVGCIRDFSKEKNFPWCSVTVHGFIDSPVTWKMNEHGFHNNGDNLCTYLIFPEGTWVYQALGDKDVYT